MIFLHFFFILDSLSLTSEHLNTCTAVDHTMDQSMSSTGPSRIQVTIPANTPFDKKWDLLKPVIEQLYVDEDQNVGEVLTIMKRDYGFAAE